MNKFLYFVAFGAGAGFGAFAAWLLIKKKYEQIAQEEIDSVKKTFQRYAERAEECISEIGREIADNKTCEEIIATAGYRDYSQKTKKAADESEEKGAKTTVYEISPDEFAANDDYDKFSWTHYSDGIFTNDYDEVVDDADDIFSDDLRAEFNRMAGDVIYIRNEESECDYEILLDGRRYSDVVLTLPHNQREWMDDDEE